MCRGQCYWVAGHKYKFSSLTNLCSISFFIVNDIGQNNSEVTFWLMLIYLFYSVSLSCRTLPVKLPCETTLCLLRCRLFLRCCFLALVFLIHLSLPWLPFTFVCRVCLLKESWPLMFPKYSSSCWVIFANSVCVCLTIFCPNICYWYFLCRGSSG